MTVVGESALESVDDLRLAVVEGDSLVLARDFLRFAAATTTADTLPRRLVTVCWPRLLATLFLRTRITVGSSIVVTAVATVLMPLEVGDTKAVTT